MNLQPLFETQKILDQRIVEQHGLEGQDLLPQKILALQVELGECANEWRGFKFWKVDAKPNNHTPVLKDCRFCDGGRIDALTGEECWQCDGSGKTVDGYKNMLLEEYVDCLHFILSIGLEDVEYYGASVPINYAVRVGVIEIHKELNTTLQFNSLFMDVATLYDATAGGDSYGIASFEEGYIAVLGSFLGLGEMLGFTWEQIEQAYFAKNEINHTRQATGY